jgi:hypothetical protein
MSSTLADIRKANLAGAKPPIAGTFVLYNFPDRDCSAKASDGELHLADNGLEKYKKEYIDPVAKLVKEYSDVRIIFVYGTLNAILMCSAVMYSLLSTAPCGAWECFVSPDGKCEWKGMPKDMKTDRVSIRRTRWLGECHYKYGGS